MLYITRDVTDCTAVTRDVSGSGTLSLLSSSVARHSNRGNHSCYELMVLFGVAEFYRRLLWRYKACPACTQHGLKTSVSISLQMSLLLSLFVGYIGILLVFTVPTVHKCSVALSSVKTVITVCFLADAAGCTAAVL